MAVLSGEHSIRGIERFARVNKEELVAVFKLKHGVPSFQTFQKVLKTIDVEDLMARFEEWTSSNNIEQEESIAIDGKVLRSTVKDPDNALQNFVIQVSAYG